MAIVSTTLSVIKHIIDEIRGNDLSVENRRILSLGYPDILSSRQDLIALFGEETIKNLVAHPNAGSIIRWHNANSTTDFIPESKQLFNLLGFDLEVMDISEARGDEIFVDLNEPVLQQYHGRYDLIIDTGTIEHCFNIAQSMKNLANMVDKGGYVFHSNPLSWFNHGFYNINPTFYYDFYLVNGFNIIWYQGLINGVNNPELIDLPEYERFENVPSDSTNIVVVKREEVKPIVWPIQTKYRNNSKLLIENIKLC